MSRSAVRALRLAPLAPLALCSGIFACTSSSSPAPSGPPRLDVPLTAGQARAGLVTDAAELVRGTTAKGRVGDYKLYNAKVAVVIAQPGSARGYHPYGGTILDADRVRPRTDDGQTTFGEVILALDLAVMKPDTVEVVRDGTDGGEARIRLKGTEAPLPFFDAIFSELFPTKQNATEWTIDYVLEPDAEALRVEQTIKNVGRETVEYGLPIVGFMFGDGARPFMPGHGFKPPTTSAFGRYYGAIADRVSYLYGRTDESLTIIVNTSGVIVAGLGEGFALRAQESATVTHHLVIGDGDLARTQAIWDGLSAKPAGPMIAGKVVDAAGTPIAGARVHVTEAEPAAAERDYVTQARTDANGRYTVPADPGRYAIVVAADGQVLSETRPIEVAAGRSATADFTLPRPGTLAWDVVDDRGAKLPVKLSVAPRGRSPLELPSRFGEPVQAYGLQATIFGWAGEGTHELPPGSYRVWISRGAEYEVEERDVTIESAKTATITATLVRSIDTTGWLSTDTHIHAQLSPDSPDLYPLKVSSMVSEGLEIPVSTEHEAIGDFNPTIRAMGLEAWIQGIVGSEITTTTYGHFNAFPLKPDPTKPGNGRVDWYKKKPGETFAAIRANELDPFLQVNHPRSPAIGGYLSAMGFDPEAFTFARADDVSFDFDALEVANGCGLDEIETVSRDWFALLNRGHRVFATGSTDNHQTERGEMGFPRTYVRMPTDDPAAAQVPDVRTAFKAGRLVVTCGPFVEVKLGAAEIGDTARVAGDTITLDVRIAAPAWMSVSSLEVIVNGRVVATQAIDPPGASTERFDGEVTVPVSAGRDGWAIVRVRGDASHGVWARNRPSFAFTNPIFLDGNDDGAWVME
ncbi:CehA/McbA family metallohydrolase [Myxococcota bacterium]|nr:CehA/McbA family metallohydrolase [Myxococcota bacterium]